MDEWQALGGFFKGIWELLKTPMTLPYIGETSPLKMMLFFGALGLLVDLVQGMLARKGE